MSDAGDRGGATPGGSGPGEASAQYTPQERTATVLAACLGWLFSAMDILLVIFLQEPIGRSLGASPESMKWAIGVGLLGSALGGMAFSQLGDRLGRARALALAIGLYSLSTGGMAIVPDVGWLMALRFLAGVGTGGEWSLGFALVTEVWRPRRRGLVGGLVASMFNLGTFLAIILYQSELHWRLVFGLAVVPALSIVYIRLRVPESRVWVALQLARTTGNLPESLQKKVRRVPLGEIFRGPLRGITLRGILLFALLNLAFYGFAPVFFNYLEWSPAQGGLGLSRREELPYQLALNLSSLVLSLVAGFLSDRLGRRLVFAGCALVGAAGFTALLAVAQAHAPQAGPPPGLLAVFMVVTAGWGMNGVIGPLLAELYPTYLRATGPGMVQNLGKGIGGFFGPALGGWLVPLIGFPATVSSPGVIFALAAIGIYLLPGVDRREVAALEGEEYLVSLRPGSAPD